MIRLASLLLVLPLVVACATARPYATYPLPARDPVVQRPAIDQWEIEWDEAPERAPVAVYLGDSPDRIDRSQPIAEMTGRSVDIIGLDPAVRPYFELVGSDGTDRMVAERRLPLSGAHNFRDIGGYETADGRHVRWGLLYRSDDLADLTASDLRYLGHLGVKLVCDFRSPAERAAAPSRLPPGEPPEVAELPIQDERFDPEKIEERVMSRDLEGAHFDTLLIEGNRAFATTFAYQYRAMFERISDPAYLPALVHCTQGKDRTGFAAAIVLLALGVPEKTVMQDYLLTNVYTASDIERTLFYLRLWLFSRDEAELLRPLLQVRRDYLQAAFDAIHEHYGSVDAYLTHALGVDEAKRERLRSMLLR
jgi:protein-tyrosine phosphatase